MTYFFDLDVKYRKIWRKETDIIAQIFCNVIQACNFFTRHDTIHDKYTTRHDWQSCIHDWKIHDTIDKRNKTGLSGIKHKYGEIKRKREWIKPGYAGIKPDMRGLSRIRWD